MSNVDGQTQLLIVGSEPEMLELLGELLADAGFGTATCAYPGDLDQRLMDPDFDVLICDELDGELDGEMIFDASLGASSGERPAFVLLGDSPDGERIGMLLDREMDEYIIKPFDMVELIARVRKVARVRETLRQAASAMVSDLLGAVDDMGFPGLDDALSGPAPSAEEVEPGEAIGFQGDLDFMNLPDLLMNLHQNARTGHLFVTVEDGDYVFGFNRGELVSVDGPKGLKGRKAFYRSMREEAGQFKFVPAEHVKGRRTSGFENLANVILQAVQEADEYPLTRRNLPADPTAVSLTPKVEDTKLPENTAIQPLLEGLIKATTIDILIHACPKTDLEAARELEELMLAEVLIQKEAAERAS